VEQRELSHRKTWRVGKWLHHWRNTGCEVVRLVNISE
jgi:hypothetical protein